MVWSEFKWGFPSLIRTTKCLQLRLFLLKPGFSRVMPLPVRDCTFPAGQGWLTLHFARPLLLPMVQFRTRNGIIRRQADKNGWGGFVRSSCTRLKPRRGNGKLFHDNLKICGNIVAPDFIPWHGSLVVERWPVEFQLIETMNRIRSGFVKSEPFFKINLVFKHFVRIKGNKTARAAKIYRIAGVRLGLSPNLLV